MFIVGNLYSKNDIYKILDVPKESQKGSWDTGYRSYNGDIFIFTNVGIPGRTGHNYDNHWDGDLFFWQGKTTSHIRQPLIQKMIYPTGEQKIYLFTRTEDKLPFTFEGTVSVKEYKDTTPVEIIWRFDENPYGLPEEIDPVILSEPKFFYEGTITSVQVNKYERNPLARRMCIEHFGCLCNVCKFDFLKRYGDLGRNYIHVHHIIPMASIKKEYILNPEKDLIPVCPNCHSMIHRKKEMLSITELKQMIIN